MFEQDRVRLQPLEFRAPWWLMRELIHTCLLSLLVLVVSCAEPRSNPKLPLAAPTESTTLGPGDVFRMQIVGEKDLPEEYQVASDGTVDLPYLNAVVVAGLEPHEVARLVRRRLIEEKILTNPSVVVRVQEYRSKQIVVLGQVKSPGSFPFQAGVTLVQAISMAGGLNSIAETDSVRLTRKKKPKGSHTVVIDLEAINRGRAEDIPLQSGDRIYVGERVF